jgi:rhodanese-related sulfurtransferase
MKRRYFLGGAFCAVTAGAAVYTMRRPADAAQFMTPLEVLQALHDQDIILIDVRRPDEWAATGLAQGATPIDMRAADFMKQVKMKIQERPDVPVAVICARGVRSRRVSNRLADAGVISVVDVPEGMLGSKAGPGWLARGLPVSHAIPN